MAVEIVQDEDESNNPQTVGEVKEESGAQPKQEQEQSAAKPANDIPERYKGKTVDELVRMNEESQRFIQRQGGELGDLRKTHDEVIKAALTNRNTSQPAQKQEAQDDEIEFFANPKQAIAKAIAEHPELQALRGAQARTQQEKNAAAFVQRHPDSDQIVNDPEFQQWVGQSRIRQALLVQADRAYDVDAADELLSTWKSLKGVSSKGSGDDAARKAAAEAAQQAALTAGIVPTGSGAPNVGQGKKIYRRSDLVRLQMTDPDRYFSMADEIQAAYDEGRVQ